MDITTLVGIIGGLTCVCIAIFMGGGLGMFIHLPSMMITVGGTFAATLINFPIAEIIRVIRVSKNVFMQKPFNSMHLIKLLVALADKARSQGFVSLEEELKRLKDSNMSFLNRGFQLVFEGVEAEKIRDILQAEVEFLVDRHERGQRIFSAMGAYAPAFGLVGTMIGLVQMLSHLDDPDKIGPSMAVALITTFYGVLMSNLIFLPIAGKLKTRTEEEVLLKEIMIEGIALIYAGENPRTVAEKLKSFIPPGLREEAKYHKDIQKEMLHEKTQDTTG